MADVHSTMKLIVEDSKNTLIYPKRYFSMLRGKSDLVQSILKAVVYGAAAGILGMIWRFAVPSAYDGMFMAPGGIMQLLGAVVASIIALFVGAAIVLVFSAIGGGSTDFEAAARVSASILVLYPVYVLFGIFAAVNFFLAYALSLAVSLYGIFLLYCALYLALGCREKTARIIAILLAIIPLIMLIRVVMHA